MLKKVLVVDNDMSFVEANKAVLESKDFAVVTAHSGDECIEKAQSESPDVILLDVMMKYDQDGLDTAIKLYENEKTKNIPVVMITGITQAAHLKESYSNGSNMNNIRATIEKPITPEELLNNVNAVL